MKQIPIPKNRVDFFSSASPAHRARLFTWNGGLYRAIRPSSVDFFEHNYGVFKQLALNGFIVETRKTDYIVEGYPLVLEHRRIPFITYPFEWPAEALKDAALLFLDLNLELIKRDMLTSDAHAWNILFHGSQPRFVDFGSFANLHEINFESMIKEFYVSFVFPLRLMADGHRSIARLLMKDHTNPITYQEYTELLNTTCDETLTELIRGCLVFLYSQLPSIIKMRLRDVRKYTLKRRLKLNNAIQRQSQYKQTLLNLRSEVEGIKFCSIDSNWVNYYQDYPPFEENDSWTEKQAVVVSVLKELKPETVLDIGSNTGWFSQLAAHLGSKCIAADVDEGCLDHLYLDLQGTSKAVTPIFLSLRNPSSSYGWSGTRYSSAMERLKSDCVLALALIHHLVFHQLADFELIVESLCKFVEKHLIIEFVSREDRYVQQWWSDKYSWYTIDNLVNLLQKKFQTVTVLPSHPTSRKLLICRNIRS